MIMITKLKCQGHESMGRALCVLILLVVLAQLAACSPRATSYINRNVDFSYVQRVAIFPFRNLSQDTQAAARVQSIFMAGILEQGGLALVDEGEVLHALQKLRISPEAALSSEQVVALGKELGVQGIFFGTVEEYGQARISNTQVYMITAAFSLLETETGSLIWNAQVSNNGTSFWRRLFGGGSASLYDVSSSAVKAAQRSLFR
jgi:hypothetical protein